MSDRSAAITFTILFAFAGALSLFVFVTLDNWPNLIAAVLTIPFLILNIRRICRP